MRKDDKRRKIRKKVTTEGVRSKESKQIAYNVTDLIEVRKGWEGIAFSRDD